MNTVSGMQGLTHALPVCRRAASSGAPFDFASDPFDWGKGYKRPGHAPQDLIIYEMSVRSFTADDSSGVGAGRQGTFLGVADKVRLTSSMHIHRQLAGGWQFRAGA